MEWGKECDTWRMIFAGLGFRVILDAKLYKSDKVERMMKRFIRKS